MHTHTLILGAGLSGLSTAYHLEQAGRKDYIVLEQANEPGGLARSTRQQGFTFDLSGHLLHLHTAYGKKLVTHLLKNNLHRVQRRAWIYTHASRVPFPFQANLFALPPSQRKACLTGLAHAAARTYKTTPPHFEAWCLRAFGQGIYEQFLRPYNTKLWGRPPRELTAEWCGPFVPLPTPTQIERSAQRPLDKALGYNTYFYYPKKGGCGALATALKKHVTVQTNTRVTRIDLKNKTVYAGQKKFTFDKLVNTLPLPVFLKMLQYEPHLASQAKKLCGQGIWIYQVAVQGKHPAFSWIYCPDKKDPFYRVGMYNSFATSNAPAGCYSLYIELPGLRKISEQKIWQALEQKGIVGTTDKKLFSFWTQIPFAYAIYDKKRTKTVQTVLTRLQQKDCLCIGRYGRWEYSFMETALLQGKEAAQKLL